MTTATKSKREAEQQEQVIRGFLRERNHLEGCPGDRVEAFPARKPPVTDNHGSVVEPAREVTVARCIECAGATVVDKPYEQAIAVDAAAEED